MEHKQQYISQSLINQIAQLSMQIAERDAMITEQHQELEKLRKEKIDEMDKEANNAK